MRDAQSLVEKRRLEHACIPAALRVCGWHSPAGPAILPKPDRQGGDRDPQPTDAEAIERDIDRATVVARNELCPRRVLERALQHPLLVQHHAQNATSPRPERPGAWQAQDRIRRRKDELPAAGEQLGRLEGPRNRVKRLERSDRRSDLRAPVDLAAHPRSLTHG
eukprot:scaffold97758_cov66-Phaeocystis_antarctica.AAC.3